MRNLAAGLVLGACALLAGGCGEGPPATTESSSPAAKSASPNTASGSPGVDSGALHAVPAEWDARLPPVKPGSSTLVRLVLINGCVLCERIDGMVRDLERQHGSALRSERFNSESPGGRAYLREMDMRRHGVVIYDRAGKPAWKNDGHSLERATLEKAVAQVVTGAPAPPAAPATPSPSR